MRKLLFILLVLFHGCAKSQTGYLGYRGTSTPTPPTGLSLIIFTGESNAGGVAANSAALPGETGVRSDVKILNNTSLAFESLNIGVNNLIGHDGLGGYQNTHHGWELGLANSVDSGRLSQPTYLLKNGQGGSTIIQWMTPGYNIYNSRFTRIDTAKTLLTALNGGVAPQMYVFYSQGINDMIAGTSTATWKANTKTWFASIRARYGTVPIFMTNFGGTYTQYNTAMAEICAEISDCYVIETTDASWDGTHWNYAGMKLIAARMVAALKAFYP